MAQWIGYADGGSRGNPGPSGFGWVLTHGGQEVQSGNGFLGKTTNNVAEWEGVIALLTAAVQLKASPLEVRADSQLVIRQLGGQYKVKQPHLKPLHARALGLMQQVGSVTLRHIPREENKVADELANEAMDRAAQRG